MRRDARSTRVLLGLLVLTSVSVIVVDRGGGSGPPLGALRSGAAAVFGPVETAAAAVARPVRDAVAGSGGRDSDAARLARENAELRRRLRSSDQARARAAELDRLLRVAGAGQWPTVPARVVAVSAAQGLRFTVTIDAGRRDGLRPDLTVINGDGLVGRVTTVGPSTATVLLTIDPESSVGARLERSSEIGVLTGRGTAGHSGLHLELLDGQARVAAGDRLVTFGSRGATPYVAGVPIGAVTRVARTPGSLTRTATVRPYVDYTALDLVGVVVQPPRTDPRDAVLPPRPSPSTPSPTP